MAYAKQRKPTFISIKLTFLKEQGDELISAVGQYVSRITAAGDSWTQGGDNNVEFQELCHMIDTATLFLCEKCQELADLTSQSITASASTPATSDSQPAAPLASTATTSHRQPAAPLASTATTSYRQSTESVQPAGQDKMTSMLQTMETRLHTMEPGSEGNVKDVQKQVEKGEVNKRNLQELDVDLLLGRRLKETLLSTLQ